MRLKKVISENAYAREDPKCPLNYAVQELDV